MPRTRASVDVVSKPEKPVEPEKPIVAERKVEEDDENDAEEMVEEEVEYEEIEEEVEEEVEEDEEEEVEEVEEEDDDSEVPEREDHDADSKMRDALGDDEKKKHAELLALPPHGSEVFLGGIPIDATEEDLRNFCKSVGELVEVRIMKSKEAGENKGYAFVMFKTKELASKAMEKLNNTVLKGKKIKCSSSQAKHKLFIGNIPKDWGEEELRNAVTGVGPGVTKIELLKDPQNSSRNRGFAFIEYYNRACAEYSKQLMSTSDFKLGDNAPTVSWADPKTADNSAASQVKAIYVKNLPKDVSPEMLKEIFGRHGKVTNVALPPAKAGQENSRYGFVHFAERASAMKALQNTERYELDGKVLECSLAKPQADQRSSGGSNSQKTPILPTYPPHVGYGLVGGLGAGFAAPTLPHQMFYGANHAGLPITPILLPDGRYGYVVQQPPMQQHTPPKQKGARGGGRGGGSSNRRGGGSSNHRGGSSSGSGKRSGDTSKGRSRYNPY
ncbi:Heterogeneous nuclear ribonucleoprotein Q-like protein [Drosera capensis]